VLLFMVGLCVELGGFFRGLFLVDLVFWFWCVLVVFGVFKCDKLKRCIYLIKHYYILFSFHTAHINMKHV